MSDLTSYKIKPHQFLTMATNVIFKTLVESQRTEAKKIFNAITEGKRIALLNVLIDDDSEVRFDLALDQSEYRGERLNFKSFRDSVTGLVGSLSESLRQESDVPVFTEKTDGSMLFGIPGLTQQQGQLNVLMLGVNARGPGSVLLKLQYVDPDQFNVEQQIV
ncbi:MAG: hypothetical protein ABJ308_12615 [Halieaceae bacterium]